MKLVSTAITSAFAITAMVNARVLNAERSEDSALCTGPTQGHCYGWEDGCGQGFMKFSYEISQGGCDVRCANTDNRVHYVTTDESGGCYDVDNCFDMVFYYYTARECTDESYSGKQVLGRNQCANINTGSLVASILMACRPILDCGK